MGEGEIIACVQKVKHGGGEIAPFPKSLRLCIIGLVLRVAVEIQPGQTGFLEVERF